MKQVKVDYRIVVLIIAIALLGVLIIDKYTGFLTYVPAEAGYITEVVFEAYKEQTKAWQGYYGLGIQVPGFFDPQYATATAGGITRKEIIFNCLPTRYIFATTLDNLTEDDFLNMSAATSDMIDEFIGYNGSEVDSGNHTFNENKTFDVGGSSITTIGTSTYKLDGTGGVFDIGALNLNGNLVFVTKIASVQQGFNPETVNYQMILPVPYNSSVTYHFFEDKSQECPSGGEGEIVNSSVYGYVFDSGNSTLENVTVYLGGDKYVTNESGYYYLRPNVSEGIFIITTIHTTI